MISILARKLALNISTENFQIRAEQMRALVQAYPSMILANVIMVPLVVGLMWGKVNHGALLCWAAMLYSFHALEVWHWLSYPKEIRSIGECKRWQRQFLLSDTLVGAVWGSAGLFMFVPGEPVFQAYMLCILMGMAAGAVAGNLVFPLSQQSYVLCVILPILTNILLQGSAEYYLLAAMVGVFLIFVMKVGLDQSKVFELSIRRGFENVELVRQLEREQAQAEAASEMKSKLLAAVSHDLRQPLYSLNLFLDALKPHVGSGGDVLQGQIARATQVLSGMFDNLLDISKLDAGAVKANCREFDIHTLLEAMREEFEWLASQKQLRLEVRETHQMVFTDAELLLSILRNLISNAIRYTEQGVISIECVPRADGLQLSVSDTGIGIAPEHMPHIFDEYFQVGKMLPRNDKGLGLGLAIVKRLEQLLGYRMQASSTPGQGTRFEFVIPLAGLK